MSKIILSPLFIVCYCLFLPFLHSGAVQAPASTGIESNRSRTKSVVFTLLPVPLRHARAQGGPAQLLWVLCGAVVVEGLAQHLSVVLSVRDLFA